MSNGILTAMNMYWLNVHGEIDRAELIKRHKEITPNAETSGRVSRLSGDGDSRRTDAARGDVKEPFNER